jgi:hypothetical protein
MPDYTVMTGEENIEIWNFLYHKSRACRESMQRISDPPEIRAAGAADAVNS